MKNKFICFLYFFVLSISVSQAQYIYTVAGGGTSKEDSTSLNISVTANALTVDNAGNVFFIDLKHHAVRKYNGTTGKVTTIAGGNGAGFSGDNGPAIGAKLNDPRGICLDASGKILYIGDKLNYRIRKVNLTSGVITTIAGTGSSGYTGDGDQAVAAKLSVTGVHADASGNLYFADADSNVIRKIDATSGVITTVAGNGTSGNTGDGGQATNATFLAPDGVCTDASGNLYIVDSFNDNVRKVNTSGIISTIAGTTQGYSGDGGLAVNAQFSVPVAIALDANGNIYVADRGNRRIRKITTDGNISTVAGKGNSGSTSEGVVATDAYTDPVGLAVDAQGNIFIAESDYKIRKVDVGSGLINTIIGNGSKGYEGDKGPAAMAQLYSPSSVYKHTNDDIYIADYLNSCIRRIDASTSTITTIAGNGENGFSLDGTLAVAASLNSPIDMAVDASNNVYIVERSANRIRKIDAITGKLSTIAGTGADGFSGDGGLATAATLSGPKGICIDNSGNIFISDNNRIRKIDAGTKKISTIAGAGPYGNSGDGGPATSALLYLPARLAADQNGNVYFSDQLNQRIRKVDTQTGIITTIAGKGTAGFSGDGGLATQAELNYPLGVTVDASGNVYIADTGNSRIRKVDAATGVISTYGGDGTTSLTADGLLATASSINEPEGVSVDAEGHLYVAETDNDRIRVIKPRGALITFSNTVAVYNGSPLNLNITVDPADTDVTITYNGSSTVPTDAGTYEVHAVSSDAQFPGSAWTMFTITKAPQTITFESPGPKALADGGFDLNATSSSGLPLSYTIEDPGVATVSGSQVTLVSTGSTTITASQSGDANYLPAESVQQTLEVVLESRVITLSGTLDFGDVPVNEIAQKQITVSNTGTASLNITGVALPAGYTSGVSAGQILAGSSLEITITFSPLQEGLYNGKFEILSNATSGNNEVDITGNGIAVTGIESLEARFNIEVYPNPSTGVFYLKSAYPIANIQLTDATGRNMGSVIPDECSDQEYQFDISHLKSEYYFLLIPGTDKVVRIKKD